MVNESAVSVALYPDVQRVDSPMTTGDLPGPFKVHREHKVTDTLTVSTFISPPLVMEVWM